jgi:hypothetical protein
MELLVDVRLQAHRPDPFDITRSWSEADPVQRMDDGLVVAWRGGGRQRRPGPVEPNWAAAPVHGGVVFGLTSCLFNRDSAAEVKGAYFG